ncbi:MAG: transcriptional regulator [Thermodesulfobacteriota bacterium]
MEEKKLSTDAFEWVYNKYIAHDPREIALFEEEHIKADIGQAVYDLRNEAGLSKGQLADLIGTTVSVIEDIEEADYEGEITSVVSRIATALHKRVEVRFVSEKGTESVGAGV